MKAVNFLNTIKRANEEFGFEIDVSDTLESLQCDAEQVLLKNLKEPEGFVDGYKLSEEGNSGSLLFADEDDSECIDVPVFLSDDWRDRKYYRGKEIDNCGNLAFFLVDYTEVKTGDYLLAARIVDCHAKVVGLLMKIDVDLDF